MGWKLTDQRQNILSESLEGLRIKKMSWLKFKQLSTMVRLIPKWKYNQCEVGIVEPSMWRDIWSSTTSTEGLLFQVDMMCCLELNVGQRRNKQQLGRKLRLKSHKKNWINRAARMDITTNEPVVNLRHVCAIQRIPQCWVPSSPLFSGFFVALFHAKKRKFWNNFPTICAALHKHMPYKGKECCLRWFTYDLEDLLNHQLRGRNQ